MILTFTREQVVALVNNNLMRSGSTTYWDVCNELKKGKTSEEVAEDMKLNDRTVRWIRCTKCPEVR